MAKEIITSIAINAPVEQVWAVLTDFSQYPQWNPFVQSLTGEAKKGSRIRVKLPGMSFSPVVKAFDTNKEFRWLGQLFVPGLFDGEHRFELVSKGKNITLFIQAEKFTGILVPLFRKMLDGNTKAGFEAMNKKLKEEVEGMVAFAES